jgi:cholesterol 24(S)-hydroxylase
LKINFSIQIIENEPFDMEDMVDDFLTFFLAGQETSANTLAFCFLELTQNPLVVQKLRLELDQVLGSKSYICIEDLNELHYTSCVIKETLRKWSIASDLNRICPYDYEIGSFKIPKGSRIQVYFIK